MQKSDLLPLTIGLRYAILSLTDLELIEILEKLGYSNYVTDRKIMMDMVAITARKKQKLYAGS
jgi:hypothetical protein